MVTEQSNVLYLRLFTLIWNISFTLYFRPSIDFLISVFIFLISESSFLFSEWKLRTSKQTNTTLFYGYNSWRCWEFVLMDVIFSCIALLLPAWFPLFVLVSGAHIECLPQMFGNPSLFTNRHEQAYKMTDSLDTVSGVQQRLVCLGSPSGVTWGIFPGKNF